MPLLGPHELIRFRIPSYSFGATFLLSLKRIFHTPCICTVEQPLNDARPAPTTNAAKGLPCSWMG